MHFATRVRTWRVARLYSEIAQSRKPFGIGHMYIYNFLLRVAETMTSQNIDLSSWDTLYIGHIKIVYVYSASMFGMQRIFWKTVSICLLDISSYHAKNLRGF
jgi:hypothetical protein